MSYNKTNSISDKITGTKVVVHKKNIGHALSLFKKKVIESGKLERYRDIQEYTKPSEKRRVLKANAIRRNKKEQNS